MSAEFLAGLVIAGALALGGAIVALKALDMARRAARHSALLWSLSRPGRPMGMRWTFSVILTERAWETLGVPQEQREKFQELLGQWIPRTDFLFLFQGHPAPSWISKSIEVRYERWGESLERWTISNSWVAAGLNPPTHRETRVLEFLPEVDETDIVVLWGEWAGPHFRFEDGRLFFLNRDENVSVMPDGKLYPKDGARILFNIPAPTLSMSRAEYRRTKDRKPLDRFASPDYGGVDGFDPGIYSRRHGQERFECEDWEKGFRWDLEVNDLRRNLDARVKRVQRTFWRREVDTILLELDSGVQLWAHPLVVEPTADGRVVPKKNERVGVVLNEDGAVDRIWLWN